jgi:hypothetical protein
MNPTPVPTPAPTPAPVVNPTWLLGIQTFLIFAQLINAQLAVLKDVPPWLTLILSALVGAGQYFVQHLGNQQVPPPLPLPRPRG